MKVGFIGVGNMGGPMCRNIIRNTNHEVVVFDLNAEALKACGVNGASLAARDAVLAKAATAPNTREIARHLLRFIGRLLAMAPRPARMAFDGRSPR